MRQASAGSAVRKDRPRSCPLGALSLILSQALVYPSGKWGHETSLPNTSGFTAPGGIIYKGHSENSVSEGHVTFNTIPGTPAMGLRGEAMGGEV